MNAAIAALFGAGGEDKLYVEDVFSAFTSTGNGSTRSATGPDMTRGGLSITKSRSAATGWRYVDTDRGAGYSLDSSSTAAQATEATGLTAFTATGADFGADTDYNNNVAAYVDYLIQEKAKFFKKAQVTKSSGSNATVDLATLGTVGMVTVKNLSTGDWYVWHRSLTAGKLLYLNKNDAEATLGHITVSGTTLTLVNSVIADGTYIVYAWAHDTSADGIIQCGSVTTDESGNATVNLGWEPQYLMLKTTGLADAWYVADSARGMTVEGANTKLLMANSAGAEMTGGFTALTSTGFNAVAAGATYTYIYLAIRRGPMRVPTDATKVYNAIARAGTGAAATVTGVGFAPDLVVSPTRGGGYAVAWFDRLRGAGIYLRSTNTAAEGTDADSLKTFTMDGESLGADGGSGNINVSGNSYINWFFRRAPGFFDEVCDTGTGSAHAVSHNLGVPPELMICKKRSANDAWYVYAGDATDYLVLNTNAATTDLDTIWNDTAPTSTQFTVGTHDDVNQNTGTFVTYLMASCPGVSKIGTFVGNGSTQNIDCGFAAGARFVLIKATSTTGDWPIGDSTRGIVAGNDPYLLLNSTAAEVTNKDWLDSYAAGFTVNETTGPNANTNGVTYLFWAVA